MRLFSQCLDKERITSGGEWHPSCVNQCASYNFAFGGDTSKNWNVLSDPIDIMQIAKQILPVKHIVDQQIKNYAGCHFFLRVKFNSVEVAYPQDRQRFIDSGRQDDFKMECAAKYYFYYDFMVDSLMSYHFGIAVNRKGTILNAFDFPSKKAYRRIDTAFSYCKLINIAKNIQKDIEPIKEIKFELDKKTNRFYWLIIQDIEYPREGLNRFNEVIIDAANLKKTKAINSEVYIDF